MKRFFFLVCFSLISGFLQAKESAEEVVDNSVNWSKDTKATLLIVWGLIVLILTVRTFRNKADM